MVRRLNKLTQEQDGRAEQEAAGEDPRRNLPGRAATTAGCSRRHARAAMSHVGWIGEEISLSISMISELYP